MAQPSDTFHFKAMASLCELRLEGGCADERSAAAQAAVDEVRRIETKYSRYQADSIVSRINAAAGSPGAVAVDDETASLLGFAAQLHALSDGLFDITSGVLRRAWDFRAARPPKPAQVAALLPLVNWTAVERDGATVRLPQAGMELDFGGFGKEYAADRACQVLFERGLGHGYVNLGGDIRVLGPKMDGGAWRFGLQHPRRLNATVASVEVAQGALATSGDYERYLHHRGQRYCHVLDPRNGWPVSHWQSVSAISSACVAAGALSTIAMLKREGAERFLQAQDVAYFAVDAQGHFHSSTQHEFTT